MNACRFSSDSLKLGMSQGHLSLSQESLGGVLSELAPPPPPPGVRGKGTYPTSLSRSNSGGLSGGLDVAPSKRSYTNSLSRSSSLDEKLLTAALLQSGGLGGRGGKLESWVNKPLGASRMEARRQQLHTSLSRSNSGGEKELTTLFDAHGQVRSRQSSAGSYMVPAMGRIPSNSSLDLSGFDIGLIEASLSDGSAGSAGTRASSLGRIGSNSSLGRVLDSLAEAEVAELMPDAVNLPPSSYIPETPLPSYMLETPMGLDTTRKQDMLYNPMLVVPLPTRAPPARNSTKNKPPPKPVTPPPVPTVVCKPLPVGAKSSDYHSVIRVPYRSPQTRTSLSPAGSPCQNDYARPRSDSLGKRMAESSSPGADAEKRAKLALGEPAGANNPDGAALGLAGSDPFIGKMVKMATGKYKGRMAYVKDRPNKKYRCQVEGVDYQLEFFGKAFQLIEENARQSAPLGVNQVEFYHGWSKKHVERPGMA